MNALAMIRACGKQQACITTAQHNEAPASEESRSPDPEAREFRPPGSFCDWGETA